jgi:biopolymer transport protein ExbD
MESSVVTGITLPKIPIANHQLIPVPTSAPAAISSAWRSPFPWLGIGTLVVGTISLLKLINLWRSYSELHAFIGDTRTYHLHEIDNKLPELDYNVVIGFSERVATPFTYGWNSPAIILPTQLKDQPQRLRTILQHELIHIQRADFLLNTFVQVLKSLCWFHPLIHRLANEVACYREISCDREVLSSHSITAKQYAQLLYEMSTPTDRSTIPAVPVSSEYSHLKKRIDFMKRDNISSFSYPKSIALNLTILIVLAGIIGCTELQSPATTASKIANINPHNPNIYIGPNNHLSVNNTEVTLSEFNTFLQENSLEEIGVITLSVHDDAHFGMVTDVEKNMRERGTLRINYRSVTN